MAFQTPSYIAVRTSIVARTAGSPASQASRHGLNANSVIACWPASVAPHSTNASRPGITSDAASRRNRMATASAAVTTRKGCTK